MEEKQLELMEKFADLQLVKGKLWKRQVRLTRLYNRVNPKHVRIRKKIMDTLKKEGELIKWTVQEENDLKVEIDRFDSELEMM